MEANIEGGNTMDNQELLTQIAQMMEEQTRKIELKIENDVTKRIDALFDGYKLTHEKQWELERQTELMQRQIQDLQSRIAALENRIA